MLSKTGSESLKTIGIVSHSYEGGSLCFITACREGAKSMGPHMHPEIIMSAIPMGLSMPAWDKDDYREVFTHLSAGVDHVAKSGADFFICPDNTAHLVFDQYIDSLPIPGLHIADVVCHEIKSKGWKKVGLLGTKWTMSGTVYENAFQNNQLEKLIPEESYRFRINEAIFEELCQGEFKQETIDTFIEAIEILKARGAECVILGCTEIPLIINDENSPLPVLDSTCLLAKYAVKIALNGKELEQKGWVNPETN